MDQTLTDQITCRLDRFEEAILSAERPDGPLLEKRDCVVAPFVGQHHLRLLLDACDERVPGIREAGARFNRLSEKLGLLKNRAEYRDALFAELKYFVGSYHAELCWQAAGAETPAGGGSSREIAATLIEELRDEYDLREIEQLMESLDDASCRMKNIPEEKPEIPRVRCHVPDEMSRWRDSPGIREE